MVEEVEERTARSKASGEVLQEGPGALGAAQEEHKGMQMVAMAKFQGKDAAGL